MSKPQRTPPSDCAPLLLRGGACLLVVVECGRRRALDSVGAEARPVLHNIIAPPALAGVGVAVADNDDRNLLVAQALHETMGDIILGHVRLRVRCAHLVQEALGRVALRAPRLRVDGDLVPARSVFFQLLFLFVSRGAGTGPPRNIIVKTLS